MNAMRFVAAGLIVCFVLVSPALAGKRVALVVGNGDYSHAGVLENPVNDANDVAEALKAVGFTVVLALDVDKAGFDGKIREFSAQLEDADDAVFFYAGHGLQVSGQNYLIPVDAKLESERDLDFEAIRLGFILRQMELQREGKANVAFLDACRDNPLARNLARSMGTRSSAVGQGLAQVDTGVGTFIAFSTQPGNVALDGEGRNSPFAAALVPRIKQPGVSLATLMIDVRNQVLESTEGRQVPWDHSSLTGDFYFNPADGGVSENGTRPAPNTAKTEELEQRIQELEQELQQKADVADTALAVQLAQLKDRSRRLQEDMREDMQTIFRLQREGFQITDAREKAKLRRQVSRIHIAMARKSQEKKKIDEQIADLEKKASLASGE